MLLIISLSILFFFLVLIINPPTLSEKDFVKHPNTYNNKLMKNVLKLNQLSYCNPKNIYDKKLNNDLMYEQIENINSSIKDTHAYVGIVSGVNRFTTIF